MGVVGRTVLRYVARVCEVRGLVGGIKLVVRFSLAALGFAVACLVVFVRWLS